MKLSKPIFLCIYLVLSGIGDSSSQIPWNSLELPKLHPLPSTTRHPDTLKMWTDDPRYRTTA